jgi:hypothetical protein
MAKITHDEIIEACLEGIEDSFNEYIRWSGGEWLWNAPEYLLTVNIAKKIANIQKNKFITLEDNIKETLKTANAKIKGKISNKARPNGRSDIILWWANGTPRGIIEVKNAVFGFEKIKEDIDRIIELLKKDSSIEFGITTFYIDRHYESGNSKEKVQKKIESIVDEIVKYVNPFSVYYDYKNIIDENIDAAFAVSIMIKR